MAITGMRRIGKLVMFIVLAAFVGLIFFQWGADISSRVWGGGRAPKGVLGRVNKAEIKDTEYQNLLRQALLNQEQANRTTQLSETQIDSLRQAVWQELVTQKVWDGVLKREGTVVTDQEVFEILKSNPPPELRDREELKTDGKFDPAKYVGLLQEPRLQAYFESYALQLKQVLPKEKVRWDVLSSYRITSPELHELLSREGVAMKATYLLFGSKFVPEISPPTAAELKANYETNKETLAIPEQRYLKFVVFPKRPSSQDSVSAKERIDDAFRTVQEGEDFTEVAKDYSDDPAIPATAVLSQLRNPAHDVLKGLKPGGVSEPFLDGIGWHVVKLLEKKGDSLRIVRIGVRIQPSAETIEAIKERVEDFRSKAKGARFDTTCKDFGLTPRDMQPIKKGGEVVLYGVPDTKPVETFARYGKVGSLSQPVKGPNTYLVFYVAKDEPKRIPTFDQVKEGLTKRLMKEKQNEFLKNYALEAYKKAASGLSLEAIAQEDSNIILDSVTCPSFSDCRNLKGPEFAGALYALRQKETSGVVVTLFGSVIIRCDERKETGYEGDVQAFEKTYQEGIISEISNGLFPDPKVDDYRDAFSY